MLVLHSLKSIFFIITICKINIYFKVIIFIFSVEKLTSQQNIFSTRNPIIPKSNLTKINKKKNNFVHYSLITCYHGIHHKMYSRYCFITRPHSLSIIYNN